MISYFWAGVVVVGVVLEGFSFGKIRPSLMVFVGLALLAAAPIYEGDQGLLLLLLGEACLFIDLFLKTEVGKEDRRSEYILLVGTSGLWVGALLFKNVDMAIAGPLWLIGTLARQVVSNKDRKGVDLGLFGLKVMGPLASFLVLRLSVEAPVLTAFGISGLLFSLLGRWWTVGVVSAAICAFLSPEAAWFFAPVALASLIGGVWGAGVLALSAAGFSLTLPGGEGYPLLASSAVGGACLAALAVRLFREDMGRKPKLSVAFFVAAVACFVAVWLNPEFRQSFMTMIPSKGLFLGSFFATGIGLFFTKPGAESNPRYLNLIRRLAEWFFIFQSPVEQKEPPPRGREGESDVLAFADETFLFALVLVSAIVVWLGATI